MKISEVVKELNNALDKYGDVPVTMTIIGENDVDATIKDIRADENSVTLYDK